jgi:acetyl-CoA synthetase
VSDGHIEAWHSESRSFAPPSELTRDANAKSSLYEEADADPVRWWFEQSQRLTWDVAPTMSLSGGLGDATWFEDGRLNACVNCVDRHVDAGRGDRVAFHWIGDPENETLDITYAELRDRVCCAANALLSLGATESDRVAIYMPMIPEAIVAMLACARLGIAHAVTFAGFSAEALVDRITDAGCTLVVTADGGYRRGAAAALKVHVDEALTRCPDVRGVIVVRRTGQDVRWTDGRDHWWHELVDTQSPVHEAASFPAEQPLYLMYTSGTTARPKGILHTTAGYLTHVATTHFYVFDVKADSDVCWTAADIGWVTGHSYIVYGPLVNGATQVIYEGTPDSGGRDRWWRIVERYKVTILYTAPTAIRTLMKWGDDLPATHDLSSLRLLGSVGEPINPEAWMWYREHVGRSRCPIVDTWWQTETGGIMASPLPGVTVTKPGAAMRAFPGVSLDVVDSEGKSVGVGHGGYLTLTAPWPGMTRGIWGDPERFRSTYFARFPGSYFAGDGAKLDDDGDLWLLGRVDDVMNVSGHRLSTTEVEHALVGHEGVAEAAVVGASDETTGQAIVAFVTLSLSDEQIAGHETAIIAELRDHVGRTISPIAKPRQIIITPDLPKTRSGKIMRRLLRDVAEHRELGDVTTLTDPAIVSVIDDLMTTHANDDE